MINVGDIARLINYPTLVDTVGWIDPIEDTEGRVVHLLCDDKTYRVNLNSLETVAEVIE